MDLDRLAVLSVILAVAALLVGGAAMVLTLSDDGQESPAMVDKCTVYFGMGDRTDKEIETVAAGIAEVLSEKASGFTTVRCSGVTVTADGQVFKDRVTLQFTLLFMGPDDVRPVVTEIQEKFGISVVLLEHSFVEGDLIVV